VSAGLETIEDYSGRDYRTVWQRPRGAFEERFEGRLISRLLVPQPGWFVDVGAGYGRLYPFYRGTERSVVMVDYAVNLLELAAESYGDEPNVHFVAANAYHLPFRPETFSGALSIRTFHHMAHPEKFFAEFGRVLRGGSDAVLEYSNKRNLLRVLRYGKSSLRRDHEQYHSDLLFGTHPNYLSELASAAGLAVTGSGGTGFLSRLITERTRPVASLLNGAEAGLDSVLGPRGLAPVSFAALRKKGHSAAAALGEGLLEILCCPVCSALVEAEPDGMRCVSCAARYPRVGAVLDFRHVGPVDG